MGLLSEENMISSTATLERAAKDGSIDSTEWENIHSTLIVCLQRSIYNDFPLPKYPLTPSATPSPEITSSPPKRRKLDLPSPRTPAQVSVKENEPSSPTLPEVPLPVESAINTTPPASTVKAITPEHGTSLSITDSMDTDYRLPPDLQETWDNIKDTLTESFSTHPPHTIQRLAELILEPRRHYKYLPAYLNALERVVLVSSSTRVFPLPPVEPSPGGGPLVNGGATSSTENNLELDHSTGGAILTPIPWLQNGARSRRSSQGESIRINPTHARSEDSHVVMTTGEALLETGPVTQGELLRKEQELSGPPTPTTGSAAAVDNPMATQANHTPIVRETTENGTNVNAELPEPEAESPHARGPNQIGMEDTGPQEQGSRSPIGLVNLDAAVGRGPQKPRTSIGHDTPILPLNAGDVDATESIDEYETSKDEHKMLGGDDKIQSARLAHEPSRPVEMTPLTPDSKRRMESRRALAANAGNKDVNGMTDDQIRQAPDRGGVSAADSLGSSEDHKDDIKS